MLIDFVLLTLVWRIKSWLLKIKSMITHLSSNSVNTHLQLSKYNVRVKGLTRKEIFCWPKYIREFYFYTKPIILQNTHYRILLFLRCPLLLWHIWRLCHVYFHVSDRARGRAGRWLGDIYLDAPHGPGGGPGLSLWHFAGVKESATVGPSPDLIPICLFTEVRHLALSLATRARKTGAKYQTLASLGQARLCL